MANISAEDKKVLEALMATNAKEIVIKGVRYNVEALRQRPAGILRNPEGKLYAYFLKYADEKMGVQALSAEELLAGAKTVKKASDKPA